VNQYFDLCVRPWWEVSTREDVTSLILLSIVFMAVAGVARAHAGHGPCRQGAREGLVHRGDGVGTWRSGRTGSRGKPVGARARTRTRREGNGAPARGQERVGSDSPALGFRWTPHCGA
jgi:hypothetical protein